MPTHSIEYLNARKAALPASGGKNYRSYVNPVDIKARDAGRDAGEILHDDVCAIFADFRAWFANSTNNLHSGFVADNAKPIPF
jgi:hypothetical protein